MLYAVNYSQNGQIVKRKCRNWLNLTGNYRFWTGSFNSSSLNQTINTYLELVYASDHQEHQHERGLIGYEYLKFDNTGIMECREIVLLTIRVLHIL